MRIHIPYISDQNIGGGYTFYRNFIKAFQESYEDVEFVSENEQHDILFVFGVTTVNGETIERSKKQGARFVLRMDGVPEDSRNSGRGTRRLVEYALQADHIVHQSLFTKTTVGMLLKANGVECPHAIIHNGVDLSTYTPDGPKVAFTGEPKILHMAYRKDNNKRYEEVLAMYREYFSRNKNANLILLGRYPTEWMTYNMGFFNGERHQRLGIQPGGKEKATMIRSCDFMFYPSFADPAPNTALEVMACGVPILYQPYGGTAEMVGDAGMPIDYTKSFTEQIEEMIEKRELFQANAKRRREDFSLEVMAAKYRNVFDIAVGAI